MYAIIMLNLDGICDPEYQDVIGPFEFKDDARMWARKNVPTMRNMAVIDLQSPATTIVAEDTP